MKQVELQKWREAHTGINIPDHLLAPVRNFPSLYANDFSDKISNQHPDISSFVRELGQECQWAYGNWAKAQHNADENRLLRALYEAASGSGEADSGGQYAFMRRFLVDYAAANHLPDPSKVDLPQDDWSERLGLGGTSYISSPETSIVSGDMKHTNGPMPGRIPEPEEFRPE